MNATRTRTTRSTRPAAAPQPPAVPATKPRKAAAPAAAKAAPPPQAVEPAKATQAAEPAKPTKAAKPPKADKPRIVLVRDSFTMPSADIELIAQLKQRALGASRAAKKSELLRAGLHALAALEAHLLVAALDALVPVKTGRPKKKN